MAATPHDLKQLDVGRSAACSASSGRLSPCYVSPPAAPAHLRFADTLAGLAATDGGLYVPEGLARCRTVGVARRPALREVAVEVMWPFVEGDYERDEFAELVRASYATFDDPEVTLLYRLHDGLWLLELFHGPTSPSKTSPAARGAALRPRAKPGRAGHDRGATSGDTGSGRHRGLPRPRRHRDLHPPPRRPGPRCSAAR